MQRKNNDEKGSIGLGGESKIKQQDAFIKRDISRELAQEAVLKRSKKQPLNSQVPSEKKKQKTNPNLSSEQNDSSNVSVVPTQPVKPVTPKRVPMVEIAAMMEMLSQSQSLQAKDKIAMQKIKKDIGILQTTFNDANKAGTQSLKKKFIKERKAIKKVLNALGLSNEEDIRFRTSIIKNLRKLEGQVVFNTGFDDDRVNLATKSIKKETGANPGYTITNSKHTRLTVKQGKTVGNTLAEVFSSMVLSEIVQKSGTEDKSQVMIANAFLVVKNADEKDNSATVKERCEKRLYAASQWSKDKASFEACQLFGLKKRKMRAGTNQVQDFEDLRKLNAACGLGLEKIFIPTALIADFDLHLENFMLKINDQGVAKQDKQLVNKHLALLKEIMENKTLSREVRMYNLITNIEGLKNLGAKVFFHKIDHDSGFYRYADPRRIVDFFTHRTAPIHREGFRLKTQPTLHLTEITSATKKGMDQLLLSDDGIERLLNISLKKELDTVIRTAGNFFEVVRQKSEKLEGAAGASNQNQRSAEFYLLNEFYHHIKEQRMPTPKEVTEVDIVKLKEEIVHQLELGTKLKVTDLHTQVYKRLLEKNELTENQNKLVAFLEKEGEVYLKDLIPDRAAVARATSARKFV